MATPDRRHAPSGDEGQLRDLAERSERERSSPEEESRLLERASAGDHEAESRLFNENLNMVIRLARRRVQQEPDEGLNEDELVQEGSLGLLDAIHTYPKEAGGFAAYATRQAEAAMSAAADARRQVLAGDAQLVADAEAYERAEISIRKLKGRAATPAELAEKLEWSVEKTNRLGEMVAGARRRHDEELLAYLEPDEISLIDIEPAPDGEDGE